MQECKLTKVNGNTKRPTFQYVIIENWTRTSLLKALGNGQSSLRKGFQPTAGCKSRIRLKDRQSQAAQCAVLWNLAQKQFPIDSHSHGNNHKSETRSYLGSKYSMIGQNTKPAHGAANPPQTLH
jgi:hypothetical protein